MSAGQKFRNFFQAAFLGKSRLFCALLAFDRRSRLDFRERGPFRVEAHTCREERAVNPPREDQSRFESPPALVAIANAAHLAGDRSLERAARRELLERYGIEVKFRRDREVCREEA
jgi:hypothetical protein